jgi:hypothetical protein
MANNIDTKIFMHHQRLKELRLEHRDLDDVIARLQEQAYSDQLQLRRLKKRKLALKDQMEVLIRGSVREHSSY